MMKDSITQNQITFKEFEQKIVQEICKMARQITKDVLEEYDKELMISEGKRNGKKKSRNY